MRKGMEYGSQPAYLTAVSATDPVGRSIYSFRPCLSVHPISWPAPFSAFRRPIEPDGPRDSGSPSKLAIG